MDNTFCKLKQESTESEVMLAFHINAFSFT